MKCFRLNEYEWYAGNDADEAIAAAMRDAGNSRDETVDADFFGEANPDTVVTMEDDEPSTTIGAILATMTKPGLVCGSE